MLNDIYIYVCIYTLNYIYYIHTLNYMYHICIYIWNYVNVELYIYVYMLNYILYISYIYIILNYIYTTYKINNPGIED